MRRCASIKPKCAAAKTLAELHSKCRIARPLVMQREPSPRLRVLAQVNGADVLAVRVSKAKRITTIDLQDKEIGGKGAAEAVAAMLLWSAPSMTKLDLRYVPVDPTEASAVP